MSGDVSTHRDLTQLSDFGADGADIPSLPNADVVRHDVLEERDDRTDVWMRSLELDLADVVAGSRHGVYFVRDTMCILVTTPDRDWYGWCECDESTCEHLCCLAQLHAIDDIELPEVDLA
ncbi:hypothetical protein [Haloarcula salina]|uniref:SWIM-type domain-containing protein n=1 Tax=Haloarcula salina TaxID=1429914 RepID=A0AA41G4C7_9EURY|nr:hypothetical protein [Haloarcula salina]MBV0903930.1 hypothetical protein [Haloarcula salina]